MIGNVIALAWAIVLLVGWPFGSLGLKKQLEKGPVSRMNLYLNAAISQVLLGTLTLGADLAGYRTGLNALERALPTARLVDWTLGTTLACLMAWAAMILEAKRHPRPGDQVVLEMLPRSRGERRAFAGVSLLAGLGEEYVMRGFCLGTVALATGSLWAAYLATTVSFGLGHLYQGRDGAVRATLLGAILGIPVVATGALIPSIVAHAATDMVSGRWSLKLLSGGSANIDADRRYSG